ncbi:MAG TPA: hypothetical protein VGF55_01355 [Gemmataceae bacterium]|jgi:hypothetical protein
MRRRRLAVVVGLLALVVAGAAWWLFSPALSANERALVGTWLLKSSTSGAAPRMDFRAERTGTSWVGPPQGAVIPLDFARWSLWGDRLTLDYEPSAVRRALRPVAGGIGVATRPVSSARLSFVTPDEIVVTGYGSRQVYTRAPAD